MVEELIASKADVSSPHGDRALGLAIAHEGGWGEIKLILRFSGNSDGPGGLGKVV